jgi:Kef-type K+ transport system membrane component KefB
VSDTTPEVRQSADPALGATGTGRRVIGLYTVLIVLLGAVLIVVAHLGHSKHSEPSIAGGYAVTSGTACLGPMVNVNQSGRYVSLSNTQSTLGGQLHFQDGELSGTVKCTDGTHAQFHARAGAGALSGRVGHTALAAALKSDPPVPGTPQPLAPSSLTGTYSLSPASSCLGSSVVLKQSGHRVAVSKTGTPYGTLTYRAGTLTGTVSCERNGGTRTVAGAASALTVGLQLMPASGAPATEMAEHFTASKQRTADQQVQAFFLAVIIVMVLARLVGSLMPRIRQPRVMGEVIAGILLGPTVFGLVDPQLQAKIFAPDITPYINVTANLGLVFYMFLVGMELDLGLLRGRIRTTAVISNTAVALPFMLGLVAAVPLYTVLAPGSAKFLAFALFVGVSMSITAFPVLARIISERRMLKRPLGAIVIGSAAIDDLTCWFIIALATAVASSGSSLGVLRTIGLAAVFVLGMALIVRPILARAAVAFEEAGRVPGAWIAAIFAGVIITATLTDKIGIAVLFGGFMMGLVMPRNAGMTEDVTRRVEDYVQIVLLPLYFVYTGLRTNVLLLGGGNLIWITVGLCALAIIGKFGGSIIASRLLKLSWRESAAVGILMNTRGLTELVALNLALTLGVISSALFAALVVMALVTTFVTGPLLRLIDPQNQFGAPPEEELTEIAEVLGPVGVSPAGGSILVAPQSGPALDQLLGIASSLARSEPPREVVIARLVRPSGGASIRAGLQSERRQLRDATRQVRLAAHSLVDEQLPVRAVALTSADIGSDLTKLAVAEHAALVLIDGRRPLLGDGIPREGVGVVLREASCDVAVLVTRENGSIAPTAGEVILVPFGGTDNDWAALEVASAVAASTGAKLRLLGAGLEESSASSMLSDAAMLVRQFSGVSAEIAMVVPGRAGVLAAAAEAKMLVIGLSERWQSEGLGETRRAIAKAAPAPILFVRRGEQGGSLEPGTQLSRYGWSRA